MTSVCDDNTQFFMILVVGVAVTSACDDNTQLVFMILVVGVAVKSACDDNTQLVFYDFSGSGCDQCL